MTCVRLSRGNVAPAAYGTGTGTRQRVGAYPAGSVLYLRPRFAEAFINGTTAPAAQQWEGPYLRIYPQYQDTDLGTGMRQTGTTNETYAFNGGGGTASPLREDQMYFEIDAIGSTPIYLPFACHVELYTDLSGVWLFDVWAWLDAEYRRSTELGVRGYPQTRMAARGQATRSLEVPLGCREFSWAGALNVADSPVLDQEETGKVVGAGTSTFVTSGIAGPGPCDRYLIGGARNIVFANVAGAGPYALTFWCYF